MHKMWKRLVDKSNERRWMAYLSFFTLMFMFTPAARVLVLVLPVAVLILSFRYVRRDKAALVELICWLYFISSFIRRVVDYKSGAVESVLLALPLLALLAPLYFLLVRWTRVMDRMSAPFGYALLAIAYGSALAVFGFQIKALLPVLPLWLLPAIFGLFVFFERADINNLFDGFERAVVGGTFFAGLYGVLQYSLVPAWDALWMETSGNITIGKPEPYEIRVFSSLNAPQILGAFMMVGILMAFRSKLLLRWPAVLFGFISLTLASVRSAWIAFVLAVVYMVVRASFKERIRVLVFLGISAMLLSSAAVIPETQQMLENRFDSLVDIRDDYSANDRSEQYAELLRRIVLSPFGQGIGVDESDAQHDSSVTNIILCLGGFGSIIFLFGFLRLGGGILLAPVQGRPRLLTLQICLIPLIVEFPLNNVLSGPVAFLTWACLGYGFAFVVRPESNELSVQADALSLAPSIS